jgi:uncharacterized protein (TIGR03437 family)
VEGQASNNGSAGHPLQSINNVTVTFGGGFAGPTTAVNALFTGLTPTAAGLYQVNVRIPDDTTLGPAVPVSLVYNGIQSNFVYLAISADGK